MTFGIFVGHLVGYGEIVKIELSLTRELNLEGCGGSEIIQLSMCFEDVTQNL